MFEGVALRLTSTIPSTMAVQNSGNVKISLKLHGAGVAELVDAADSKSASRKGVKVRFLSPVPFFPQKTHVLILVNAN